MFPIIRFYNPDSVAADQYWISEETSFDQNASAATQTYSSLFLDVAVMQDPGGRYSYTTAPFDASTTFRLALMTEAHVYIVNAMIEDPSASTKRWSITMMNCY